MDSKQSGWYQKTDKAIMKMLWAISTISGICLVGIMLVAFFNVLGEKLFHQGIPGSTEIITYLHVPVVFLAASYVTLDNGHTRIDLISKHLPATLQKIFTTIGFIIAAGICVFVAYNGFVRMGELLSHHTQSSVSGFGFSVWPFAMLFSVGMILLAISFVWAVIRQYADPDYDRKSGPAAPMGEESEGGNE